MNRIHNSLIIIALAVCASCVKEEVQAGLGVENENVDLREQAYIPGEVILQLDELSTKLMERTAKSGITTKSGISQLDVALEGLGVKSIERVFPDAGEWEDRHREAGLHRFYRVVYDENKSISTKAGNALNNIPGVVSAEPVYKIKQLAEPYFNDPYYSNQWHYSNPGGSKYTSGADINVLPVWKEYTAGSSNVVVSVVDGGVNLNHPDLHGVVLEGGPEGSYNFYDGNYSIVPEDHGTHVAGTIAAINNNGVGLCGVAGGDNGTGGVRIMSCQIFSPTADGSRRAAEAIIWGADHGAVISQNSWGYDFGENGYSDALNASIDYATKAAVDYFIQYAGCDKSGKQRADSPMKGGVVIFAAGNDGWDVGWPGKYEPIIAVGAMSSMGTRAYYSNYGDWVDISAPGGDYYIGPMIWSTVVDGYGSMQGTSMACPHVSGVAALLVSYYGGQGFTNEMLTQKLLVGANTNFLPGNAQIGPLVDAYGSFLLGESKAPERVEDYSVDALGGGARLKWTVGADEDGKIAYAYKILASKNASDFEDLNPKRVPSTVAESVIYVPEGAQKGDEIEGIINGLDFSANYYISIAAFDYGMSYSDLAEIKSVTTLPNAKPIIRALTPSPWRIPATQSLSVQFEIYDPDGHDINITFTPDSRLASARNSLGSDGYYYFTVNGQKEKEDTYVIRYSVTDAYGANTEENYLLTILPNASPVILKEMDNMIFNRIGESTVLDASEYFSDPDGDVLTYTVSHSNPRVVHVSPVGNKLTITTLDYGADDIVIRAADAKNEYVQVSFSVRVRDESVGADVYPSQVMDELFVSGGLEAEAYIQIISSTGMIAFSDTLETSAFAPAKIDVSGLAPGIYTVKVVIDGVETVRTIVKL